MRAMYPAPERSVRLSAAPEPEPAEHEAVVEVAAYSVNRGETLLLDSPVAGWRPGKDIAGMVVAAAADGSGPPIGTRVVGHPAHSGWAERVAVPTGSLAAIGGGLTTATAAALPLAGLTALRLLRRAGSVAGRRLLVTGASGGVGHYLTELAVGAGAEVVAVSATEERGARLRELGAHTVTDVAQSEGWYDVAMDSVGGPAFAEVRRRVHPDGAILWFGQASRQPITIDFFDWVRGTAGARIEQFHYEDGGAPFADDLATLVRLVDGGRLHPEIGSLLPWEHTAQIVDELRSRRIRGNAVLEVTA